MIPRANVAANGRHFFKTTIGRFNLSLAAAISIFQMCNHTYAHRDPQTSALYRALSDHLQPFQKAVESSAEHTDLPVYVIKELHKFLECGVPEFGFSRWCCSECRNELILAHSCKGRGFCPSCGGRRMSQTSANLIDRVFPEVPVRQWVTASEPR